MQYTGQLDAADVARTFRVLNQIDKRYVQELRKGMRGELAGDARRIAAAFPATPPHRNIGRSPGLMSKSRGNFGRWEWEKPTGTISLKAGRVRNKAYTSLVAIVINHKGAWPIVLETMKPPSFPRPKSKELTPQGIVLYRNFNNDYPGFPNGGRIFFKEFLKNRRTLYQTAEKIINDWSNRISKEI